MVTLKNLESSELLVMLDRKRHLKLAPAGESGDTKTIDDRHMLPDRRESKVIQQLKKAGRLEIVQGSFSDDLASPAVALEQFPGLKAFDLQLDLEGAAGVTVDVGAALPATAMLLSAQLNVEEAITAGGTSVAVGLGTSGDPDMWGKTTDLTKDEKIDFYFTPPLAALGGPTQVAVSMVTGAGAAGDTAATAGKVRVRVMYLDTPDSLPDA